jgi:cobalt-zinc-cadmium efflux system membrane fusion protein
LAAVPVALIVAVAFGVYWSALREVAQDKPQAQAAAQLGPTTLRFPPGAPQLSFLRIQPVAAYPEPVTEPLNARIAYDENRTARVSSPLPGRVARLLRQPGDVVNRGDPLAEIDAPDYAAAQADLRRAEADTAQKRTALERVRTLFEGEVAPRKDLELARADLGQAEAELARARERLRMLNLGRSTTGESFVLRAPLAGVVTERKANPGSEVRPDLPDPLFVISDPKHLWAVIDVPERTIARIQRGQKVALEADAYSGERQRATFAGTVEYIGDVLDPDTRRVPVRTSVENPHRLLKPEMYARATPLASSGRELVRVPNAALGTDGLYSFVFVEREPGVLERRPVTLSNRGKEDSYVAEGLKPGERVVTSGAVLLNSELASGE